MDMKKKLVVLFVVMMMLLSYTVALADEGIEPYRYSVVHLTAVGLTIGDGGFASGSARCETQRDADIDITAELQQYKDGKWKTIYTETCSAYGDSAKAPISRYVAKGYSYRIKATFDVDDGDNQETVIAYSQTASY